ncbi:MAG: NADH-quinone oxidoreductase subunit C [Planctomycetota bacterium]
MTLAIRNAEAVPLADVPNYPSDVFRDVVLGEVEEGGRIAALFGVPHDGRVRLYAVVADDHGAALKLLAADVEKSYPALAPECPQAQLFEREVWEQHGVMPEGHPWLKPVRRHPGYRNFYRVEGEEVHEVAVGPVHAGVIEPGHFRFQCHGEDVFHLEISLGYQHRGVERALVGGPTPRTVHYMETLAGDTTIGHTTAYCHAVEALSRTRVPARAHILRGVALELERLANHTGDLGALANDVAYLPTASYCGRLRGEFLNLTALVCGNRFGRGWLRPGGVRFDLEPYRAAQLSERLEKAARDVEGAVELLWKTPSVVARFEDTGTVSREDCLALGLVGPSARACGVERDVRRDHPTGIWSFTQVPVSSWHTGDVFARAYVRWMEVQRSIGFIRDQVKALPSGETMGKAGPLEPDRLVVSLVEGWRGEVCHVAATGRDGRFAAYKVVDPSFHNWSGLAMALRGQQISDFPLCNKSFNLSYCGHDL